MAFGEVTSRRKRLSPELRLANGSTDALDALLELLDEDEEETEDENDVVA